MHTQTATATVPPSSIMIVDDEESLRLTFERFIERAGFGNVDSVGSYPEAISRIEQARYDLIISDIVLDGYSGIEILRRARELGHDCPVVMVTGYPNIQTAAEAVRLGAFDYLPKPVKKDALLQVVGNALEAYQEKKKLCLRRASEETIMLFRESVLRVLPELLITTDRALRVVEMNELACDWCSRYLPELRPGVAISAISHDIARACQHDGLQVLHDHREVADHRVEWCRTDGSHGVLQLSAVFFDDAQQGRQGVIFTARDVSGERWQDKPDRRPSCSSLVSASPAMAKVHAFIASAAGVDATVLVTGESGTGKELVAEALHQQSTRAHRSLVKVDCAAISEEILESELFGHVKGAFTGASQDRLGRILQADGGTLFLDEIGDITPRMQLRLLRFLQERTFYPVGNDRPIQADVRVIAATNADLKKKVFDGSFREDLYYRLQVVELELPPLRDREGDIPILARHFLKAFEKQFAKGITSLSDAALVLLSAYHWPGNVRELKNAIERAYIMTSGSTIEDHHLSAEIIAPEAGPDADLAERDADDDAGPAQPAEAEKIRQALQRAGGNKAKAARILGIDRSTLYRKLALHHLFNWL